MASTQAVPSLDADLHHKRTKSSVLKSFIHMRTLSKGTALSSATDENTITNSRNDAKMPMQMLPMDHPHSRALNELHRNYQSQPAPSPTRYQDDTKSPGDHAKSLHKNSRSTISLKSIAGKDSEKPKKTKSSTNLAALLSRPKSSKNLKKEAAKQDLRVEKDKENRTPEDTSPTESSWTPPIYAQFSSQHFVAQPYGGKFLEDEINLYTPREYSLDKQRNFYEGPSLQPTLSRDSDKRRPKSTFINSSYSIQDLGRQFANGARRSVEQPRRVSFETRVSFEGKSPPQESKTGMTVAKRGSRVMAAVAALSNKAKNTESEAQAIPDIKDVDAEFEAMLDRRNIPEHQRHKMRTLALSMKKDFIRQDWAESAAANSSRPGSNDSDESSEGALRTLNGNETKPKRPRSRTFTLSKSNKDPSSASKKSKPQENASGHTRTKSWDNTTKSLTSTGAAVANTLIAKAKGQLPDDFVAYLRKVQKPELVEVGKLHKLRLLLRNETVAWTDEFIGLGGMKEIVELLHRTIAVEWRCVVSTPLSLANITNIQGLQRRT